MELAAASCLPGTHGFAASASDLIAKQAARTPGRVAITWQGGAAWSYAELMARADAIARNLLHRGVIRGELVGICLPRRPDMIAAVLGVMRAGAAYLPLDPVYPAGRIRYMAEHAGIRHVLVWRESETPAALPPGTQRFALDGFDPVTAPAAVLPNLHGDDLAYVLYTSGSTGQPKGVRVLHRNLVNFLVSMRKAPGIAANDVLCASTTLSFDIAALELYLPLMVGARIVLASESEQVDPVALTRLLQSRAVTMFQTTPTALRMLLNCDRGHALRGIKLLVGGEAMSRDLAESMLPACRELWNLYGPTETTVWSTIHQVTHGSEPVPLGKPIANTSIHILDDTHTPVTGGSIGEIWIGGAGVADGYLHDPARTAERFLPDPLAADESRMYRTGDLGSLHQGVLHFHGRADDQIKLRGYRIEPGDIEAAARAEAGVKHAVAVAREIVDGDRRLILYVVTAPDPTLPPRLRASLRDRLPGYMCPQHIEVLADLPLTPNGKIDRKALPLPKAMVETEPAVVNATPGPLEAAMLEIWRELLKVRQIGLRDDFFELGGDSLLAVRVFERMQALTGINLPLATLLAAPTVAQQAAAFRAAGANDPITSTVPATATRNDDPWSLLVPLQPRGNRPPLFLVHAIGGNVLNYAPLARGLGAEQPVYGIQAIGLDGITPPVASLQTMAACYVAEIQRRQPHGPYFLGGGSMGGLIAYEIAQQLRGRGEPIGLLAMMDTYGPGYRYGDAGSPALTLVRVILAPFGRARRMLDAMRVRLARAAGRPLPHALRYREIERVHYHALTTFRPQPFDGHAVLFRASAQPFCKSGHESLGWSGYLLGGVEVIDMPGDHDHLIEQPDLLWQLRALLERAHALP